MNVLSLFDGLSGCRIALERVGIPPSKYYASEIDKYAIKVAQANYPDTVQLGSVTEWQNWDIDWSSIDLVTGGFPCFVAGTLVTTRDGLKPIEEVKKGDEVITHKHRFKKVVVPMIKVSDHFNLVKIQGSHELKVTDEHPFYVRELSRKWDNELRRDKRCFSEPKWVDCKDLTTNHFVGVPINQNSISPSFSSDIHFWYMIGRYVADGYSSTTNKHSRGKDNSKADRRVYKTIITCGKHEEPQMDSIINSVDYHTTKSVERTSIKYTISNKELWEFVQSFGRGAENKEIPPFLFDAPIEIIKSFLNGYLSGDGCLIHSEEYKRNKNMSQLTTVSEKLAYGLIQLVQKAYKTQPTITKAKVASKKIIEGREVNQKPFFAVRFYKQKPRLAKYFEEDGFIWTPFKSKERFEESIPVYNFEVEDDNSYAVNNLIVHNCQVWSVAGKQMGDKDERGMLFWTMLDVMKQVRKHNPNAHFLVENVKMKKDFEQYITHHTVQALGEVHKILINSALVSAQNRNRYYWTSFPVTQPEDKGIVLADIIESGEATGEMTTKNGKSYGLTASYGGAVAWNSIAKKQGSMILERPCEPREFNENSICHREPKVLCGAMRGRYIVDGKRQDHKMKTAGLTEQRLEIRQDEKTNSLTTVQKDNVVVEDLKALTYRKLTPLECERLQTLPDNYTAHVSNSQRYKMIGNGWTIDVIAHILHCMLSPPKKKESLFGF
jgi:DNA (cytosine-5)-methyltransferase 1/DNA (cytosine-5)-methyltransferase 3A